MHNTGIILWRYSALPFRILFTRSPAPIGKITIFTISHIILPISISISCPARNFINKGVRKGADKVETALSAKERATLALARQAMTFDAMPPGAEPKSTIPAPLAEGKPHIDARQKQINGISQTWTKTAT